MTTRLLVLALACTAGCAHAGPELALDAVGTFIDIAIDAAAASNAPAESDEPDGPPLPDTLDRDSVALGLVDAGPELQRCAEDTPITTTIVVRPNGDIEKFAVDGSPAAGDCVANALAGVSFVRTIRGARFRYIIRSAPRRAGA